MRMRKKKNLDVRLERTKSMLVENPTEYKGKYGFIDGDANEIIPFKYKHVEDFFK